MILAIGLLLTGCEEECNCCGEDTELETFVYECCPD